MNRGLIPFAGFCLTLAVPALAAAASSWSPWLSEETNPYYAFCDTDEAVSGFMCSGSYCDNNRIRCETLPYNISTRYGGWSGWYSEEDNGIGTTVSHDAWYNSDNSYSHVCRWSGDYGIMSGFACAGSNCDLVNLYCTQPVTNVGGTLVPAEMTKCAWSIGDFSEEEGFYGAPVGSNRFIAGVECNDSYCDNKRFYVCSLEPATNSCEGTCGSQAPDGCWCDSACTGYGDCCSDYGAACD